MLISFIKAYDKGAFENSRQTFSYNVLTIFSGNGRGCINLGLQLKDEANPTFWGNKCNEYLCFNKHFENLRAIALKILSIIKIFSHKSWHLSKKTLTCVSRLYIKK